MTTCMNPIILFNFSLCVHMKNVLESFRVKMTQECVFMYLPLLCPKKYLAYNIEDQQPLQTLDGTTLEKKDDFKHLGSWTDSSEKDVRKAQAWRALNDMNKIWSSNMSQELKRRFFTATVESILLYGCEAWTITTAKETALDGTYTRMLRKAMNIHWSSKTTNKVLYGFMEACQQLVIKLPQDDSNWLVTATDIRNCVQIKSYCGSPTMDSAEEVDQD